MLLVKLCHVNKENAVIQTLPFGEHTIGRGPMLKCFDKRVSRKHAILNVKEDSVTLTPVHVNPCFYIANGGTSVVILTKDTPRVVDSGDKFALLPDQFWYKILIEPYADIKEEPADTSIVKKEEFVSKSPQLTQYTVSSPTSVHSSRQSVGNDTTIPCTDAHETSIISKASNEATKQPAEVSIVDSTKSSNSQIATTSAIIYTQASNQEINSEHSQSLLGSNVTSVFSNPTVPLDTSQPIKVSTDETKQSTKRGSSEDICSVSSKQAKITEERIDADVIKDENVSRDQERVEEESQFNLFLVESGSGSDETASKHSTAQAQSLDEIIKVEQLQEEKDIKMEMLEDELIKQDSEHFVVKDELGTSKEECEGEDDVCAHTSKVEDTSNAAAGPSKEASGSKDTDEPTKKQRRDRCWYGDSCYRKHPSHRVELSHPGDDDYESDPEDKRPTCSYGAACYRRNALHRQQYKHPGPPAPRPNAGPRALLVAVARGRRAANRPNYNNADDDDDDEDPFMDDGSSDEYVESGYSGSDTDEEYSQSQQDEDIKRLLNEANKFCNQ